MRRKLVGFTVASVLLLLFPTLPSAADAGNVVLCATVQSRTGESNVAAIENLEARIGRRFAAHKAFFEWDAPFPRAVQVDDARKGRTAQVNWKAMRKSGQVVRWSSIAAGGEDAVIRRWAADMKAYGRRVYLTFHHEPENNAANGTASDFIAAFRHVRTVFDQEGVTNVTWVVALMAMTFNKGNGDRWWPGDEYVDMLGLNGYNWAPHHGRWRTLSDIFQKGYSWGAAHGKPMMITETGVQEDPSWAAGNRKAQWFHDALKTLRGWPLLKVFCYWHAQGVYCSACAWWIDTSEASLNAFREIANDPWMQAGASDAPPPSPERPKPKTTLVSASLGGSGGNAESTNPAISSDGSVAAFESSASNLVGGDTNSHQDVFVRERSTGATNRISVSSSGSQGNGGSGTPVLSGNGRFVAFSSDASNLVGGDTNARQDVFVRDRSSGTTTRISVSSSGKQSNGWSGEPAISHDGRLVAFSSDASNLVAGDTNEKRDVFVFDRSSGTTTRISVSSSGKQGNARSSRPAMSGNGEFVAFQSKASNLNASGDTNDKWDVFLRDRTARSTVRVSVTHGGSQATGESSRPVVSADGRVVAFQSKASNLNASGDMNRSSDVFVRNRDARSTIRVSVSAKGKEANGPSYRPSISQDGRSIAFQSDATNLNAAGDGNGSTDVYLRNRDSGKTIRVSVSSKRKGGNFGSFRPSLSDDGRFVAFASRASNLTSGENNGMTDVFLRGPLR